MRIIFFDIDSLRPDHLGCYGYHRNTSPNIDRIAKQGIRFDNCYASDAPCLPSRTALMSGLFGIHNGVINHGGTPGDPFIQGRDRGFQSRLGHSAWPKLLRDAGLRTVSVSPFAERHSAWHFYAGFNEIHNTGKYGAETADEISAVALDWLTRNGKADSWFLHVNLWDPHTPYRTPTTFGNPFQNDPLPAWLTEDLRQFHWKQVGPHSAQEPNGFGTGDHWEETHAKRYLRLPRTLDSMQAVRALIDGYDTGVRYADEYIGRMLNALADQNVLDKTVVIITADHGENLGELGIYCDHMTADQMTTHLPMVLRWPGLSAAPVDPGLHYQFDVAATIVELLGGKIPPHWDGQSFAAPLRSAAPTGRPALVVSQGAWSCQRCVRFDDYMAIRSYHDGFHDFPDTLLFDLTRDPHEQYDLAPTRPDLVGKAMTLLDDWHAQMMRTALHPQDPMWTVLHEGGPLHTRGQLPAYLERLRRTGRSAGADALATKHPRER